ncbi:MAG TPA: tRNA pseudouridine(55) synthase TruB [Thiotrichales bacterium]|nr:tRNA pseudouridine(55) synthase TruB [Thiotrichales bacterium]
MGRKRSFRRDVSGILLLDKPLGMTSNEALQKVKRYYKARKAGHTGSLDPLATGMLPLCFGEATKVSAFLLDADKRYRLGATLGVTTETGDSEGAVIEERPVPPLDETKVEEALARFRGEIEQIPPMYSALKHEGERLYNLARKGVEVKREPRRVTIHALELIAMGDDWLELEVHCSKGTYVRTLAEDIGEALGCGAHVSELRRTQVGPYDDPDAMVTMEQVEAATEEGFAALDALLLPIESALAHWPAVTLNEDSAYYLRQGQPVLVPKAPTSGMVRLFEAAGRFIGAGEIQDDGRVAPRRLFHTGTTR